MYGAKAHAMAPGQPKGLGYPYGRDSHKLLFSQLQIGGGNIRILPRSARLTIASVGDDLEGLAA